MNNLNVFNKTSNEFLFAKECKLIIQFAEKKFTYEFPFIVDLIIIGNKEMQELSQKYRNKDAITDILSFPQNNPKISYLLKNTLLGEIYICYSKVIEQAILFSHSFEREFLYLFSHGLIHLLGFNHITKGEKKIMDGYVDDLMNHIQTFRS